VIEQELKEEMDMRVEEIKKAILAGVVVLGFWGAAWATDGLVNTFDFSWIAKHWLQSSFGD